MLRVFGSYGIKRSNVYIVTDFNYNSNAQTL